MTVQNYSNCFLIIFVLINASISGCKDTEEAAEIVFPTLIDNLDFVQVRELDYDIEDEKYYELLQSFDDRVLDKFDEYREIYTITDDFYPVDKVFRPWGMEDADSSRYWLGSFYNPEIDEHLCFWRTETNEILMREYKVVIDDSTSFRHSEVAYQAIGKQEAVVSQGWWIFNNYRFINTADSLIISVSSIDSETYSLDKNTGAGNFKGDVSSCGPGSHIEWGADGKMVVVY